jgi:hypothetical protein
VAEVSHAEAGRDKINRPGAALPRLGRLAGGGLVPEVALRRGSDDLLPEQERQQFLGGIQDALAGEEAGRVVPAAAVKRMERG